MRRAIAALAALLAPLAALAQPAPNLGNVTATTLNITDGAGNTQPMLQWFNNSGVAVREANTVTLSNFPTAPALRQNMYQITVQNPVDSTAIWENDTSFMYNNGPGIVHGELNLRHSYFQNNAGAQATTVNSHESSVLNSGILGSSVGYLALYTNDVSPATTTAATGLRAFYYNNNPTAGTISTWAAMDCEPKQGAGSLATNSYCLLNKDAGSDIVTLGHVNIGAINHVGALLQVNGPDALSGTIPFVIRNSAANTFYVDDSGVVTAPITFKSPNVQITGPDTSSGTFPLTVKNSAAASVLLADDSGIVTAPIAFRSGNVLITGPDTSSATYPLTIKNSAAASVLLVDDSGAVNVPIQFKSANVQITGTDTLSSTYPLAVKNSAAASILLADDSGGVTVPVQLKSANVQVTGLDNAAGTIALAVKNLAGTIGFAVNNAGGTLVSGIAGANCAAGTVSLTTLVVTNGIVTHC